MTFCGLVVAMTTELKKRLVRVEGQKVTELFCVLWTGGALFVFQTMIPKGTVRDAAVCFTWKTTSWARRGRGGGGGGGGGTEREREREREREGDD